MKLSSKILNKIDKQGYILECNAKGKGQTEIQWKRSIQEILDLYGLIKLRASKANKNKYNLPDNIPYQSFVIVKISN